MVICAGIGIGNQPECPGLESRYDWYPMGGCRKIIIGFIRPKFFTSPHSLQMRLWEYGSCSASLYRCIIYMFFLF